MSGSLSAKLTNLGLIATSGPLLAKLKRAVVLRSIPKSGTIYLRMLLTNYVGNAAKVEASGREAFARISYDEMHQRIFPNVRDHVFRRRARYVSPRLDRVPVLAAKYADFMYDHGCALDKRAVLRPAKLMLLFRNPLDVTISRHFYLQKASSAAPAESSHPRDEIDSSLSIFIPNYRWMRDHAERVGTARALPIAYERLMLDPHAVLDEVVAFLELAQQKDTIELAVAAASISATRREERARGAPIHSPSEGKSRSFARSGEIGQWRQYFSPEEIAAISRRLAAGGIDLSEFILGGAVRATA